ncbi:MAG: glycosyltransferase [Thermoguttaceae bacterium]|nr:glycosyltransferase [Thermoguttaceae bacterium]
MLSKESISLAETEPGLVSVLIPAYNHEQYVQETIQSIIAQTFNRIELIIIDDGSRDSTWQKINEMKEACEARFQRVVFQTQENAGTCITLNRLITQARGEFIYLIASDDAALPEAIQTEYDFLSKSPAYSLAVGNSFIIDENSQRCAINAREQVVPLGEEGSFDTMADFLQSGRCDFDSSRFGSYSSLWKINHVPNGSLTRKSIFTKVLPFTPEAPLEDFYMMMQIAKFSRMKYLDVPLFCYRRHSTCTSYNVVKMSEMNQKTRNYEWKCWVRAFGLLGPFFWMWYCMPFYIRKRRREFKIRHPNFTIRKFFPTLIRKILCLGVKNKSENDR